MAMRVSFLVVCLVAVAGIAAAGSPPYYIGEVLPTPKRATYQDTFVPVYDVKARRPLAAIVAGAAKAEQLAAQDLIARVCELAGLQPPSFEAGPAGQPPAEGNTICLGQCGLALDPAPKGEQAYAIRTTREGDRFICHAVGGGPMGTYFAAMSLIQLLKVEGDKVVLRAATVDDWPTFEMRGTCCYEPEQARWLALARFSTLDMNYGSVGTNAWRNPDAAGMPEGWGRYGGAGSLACAVSEEDPHGGKRCVSASILTYYPELKGKRDIISAALMLGNSDGYKGDKALPAAPGKYRMTAWVRGNVPEVSVKVPTWKDSRRDFVPAEPGVVKPTADWRKHEFTFELPAGPSTFAPQFSVIGSKAEGYNLGDGFLLDDVVLTREGAQENLAPNGDAEKSSSSYSVKVAALWDWATPRGLWPAQYVNPLHVSGWEEDGKLKIQVSDPKQIGDLARTFRISLDRGGTWIMLALDDFSSRLGGPAPYYIITNEADRKAFKSLGECHGVLARELYTRLKKTHPHVRMIVCPAYYWNPKRAYQAEGEKYLREFGRLVPEDALIVWTGPAVRSRRITTEDVRYFTDLIGRKPYLWDNTIYARHSEPTYVLDPFASEYPDRFWEMISGGLHNNGGVSEVYKAGCLVYGDYAWNPEAYDPAKSLDKALRMVVGEGCAEDANTFRDNFYAVRDPHFALMRGIGGKSVQDLVATVGPLTGKDIEEIAGHVEAMDAALTRLKAKSPNKPLLDALDSLAAPLRASAEVLKKHGDLTAHAVKKIDGGIQLAEWAFVGGAGHAIYSKDCLPRRATWVYGKKTKTHTMKAAFNLDQVPAAAALVITGLDSDKEGVTRVEIALNGKSLYKGPNRCQKQGWTDWRLDLPAGALKAGQNTLSIRNLEDSDSTNSRWFMLSEAKLLWSQKP